ncbi:hypothetical protein A8E25_18120 [Burkholderia cenocepacia]|nr:hypothetical protein A8E17_19320 [Burkholderia cenocepacia]ONR68193.1 hypothetical protein A8E23_20600 [Burkholderia cenocepacia]ONR71719.1 hypothetical protein A8E18_16290 [Burkholderia cenocepacia]ONR78631.1 hypothetical protein A8E22_19830 [Burkholderia cenocepacia]ONR91827.1 hypothetical protein A8E25_18120 [Burkholderia cenocepacia]
MNEKLWTVARFPSGTWCFGGRPDDSVNSACELWQVRAATGKAAVKKAQGKRSRDRKRVSEHAGNSAT